MLLSTASLHLATFSKLAEYNVVYRRAANAKTLVEFVGGLSSRCSASDSRKLLDCRAMTLTITKMRKVLHRRALPKLGAEIITRCASESS